MASEMDIQTVISMMGSQPKQRSGRNLICSCPLSNWTHAGGNDDKPSMSIMVDSPHLYYCFACQAKGNIKNLAWEYSEHSGNKAPYDYIRGRLDGKEVQVNFYGRATKERFKSVRDESEKLAKQARITEENFQEFRKSIPNYAFDRGLDRALIDKYEIGYSIKEKRMIIPVRDFRGHLVGWSGRDVTNEQMNKYKHVAGFEKEKYLYGEKFLDESKRIGYGVEGFMDVINISRFGLKNVMANMGVSYSSEQINKIKAWFDKYVFLPDFDDKGQGLQWNIESGWKMLDMGVPVVGIAGVIPNDGYIDRPREELLKERKWKPSDFPYRPVESLVGKDPGDWVIDDLKIAFGHIQWLKK